MLLTPLQRKISEEDVESLCVHRCQPSTGWQDYLKHSNSGKWSILLPFCETYENSFKATCDCNGHCHHANGGRLSIFLNDSDGDEEAPEGVVRWLDSLADRVAIQDLLALSFALDFTNLGGNPQNARSEVSELRSLAKVYDGQVMTQVTKRAAKKLASRCSAFIESMICYQDADCIVAMPPSDPTKAYNLPQFMAKCIAADRGLADYTEHMVTIARRASVKNAPVAEKLSTLKNTIQVSRGVFSNKAVILLDDLYQSGTSMNYCAYLLLKSGADRVYGLACEKTCRNDDNVR